ncbi:hypothetical protein V6N13_123577 [Hibiscus sabdariffa]|uniref:ABC transmembrane type-1 domain-containing protein n=1 Tax=Hibiscus sabdariffa TaxID=183260 RepID=A0ABR2QTW9_9ROSI
MADEGKSGKEVGSSPVRKNKSIRSILMHADGVDKCLMAAGLVGSVVDGIVSPLIIYLMGRMFNNIGACNALLQICPCLDL